MIVILSSALAEYRRMKQANIMTLRYISGSCRILLSVTEGICMIANNVILPYRSLDPP